MRLERAVNSRKLARWFGLAALLAVALVTRADVTGTPTAVTATTTQATSSAPRIPAAIFARNPDFTDPQLSPRGDKLLAISVVQGHEQLFVRNLVTHGVRPVPVPDAAEIQWYDWAGDDRALVSVAWPERSHRDEELTTRLLVVDLATNATRELADATAGPRCAER